MLTFLLVFLGVGILFMHTVRQELGYEPKPTSTLALVTGTLLALMSAFLLIVSAMGRGYPVHWLWPVALAVVLSFFLIYWALFRLWLWSSERSSPGTKFSTVRIYEYHPKFQTVVVDSQGRKMSRPVGSLATIDDTTRDERTAQDNQSPPSESIEELRIKQKLAYRWNVWGETRLIVYNVSSYTPLRFSPAHSQH